MYDRLTPLQQKRVKAQEAALKAQYARERRKKADECVQYFIQRKRFNNPVEAKEDFANAA